MMGDSIDRKTAIETVRKCAVKEVTPAYMLIDKAEVMTDLMLLPSAQPQITHCAECIHWKHSDVRKNYCEVFDWVNTADDFCSFAERRTDE